MYFKTNFGLITNGWVKLQEQLYNSLHTTCTVSVWVDNEPSSKLTQYALISSTFNKNHESSDKLQNDNILYYALKENR